VVNVTTHEAGLPTKKQTSHACTLRAAVVTVHMTDTPVSMKGGTRVASKGPAPKQLAPHNVPNKAEPLQHAIQRTWRFSADREAPRDSSRESEWRGFVAAHDGAITGLQIDDKIFALKQVSARLCWVSKVALTSTHAAR